MSSLCFCPSTPVTHNYSSLPFYIPPSISKWQCSRMTRRRHKLPRPPPVLPARILPTLPKPGETTERFHSKLIRGRGGIYDDIRKIVGSRRDVYVMTSESIGLLSAALSRREKENPALILVPTREHALIAAKEADFDRRGARVILALGSDYSSAKHPAMHANASKKVSIVIGTPRSIVRDICESGHGRPWLLKVRFLAVFDPEHMIRLGAQKEMERILKALSSVEIRRNFLWTPRKVSTEVEGLIGQLIRESCTKIGKHMMIAEKEQEQDQKRKKNEEKMDTSEEVVIGTDEQLMSILWNEVADHAHGKRDYNGRLMVVFQTARIAEWYSTLCRSLNIDVIDIHSKSSPGKRDAGLEKFFQEENGIMFCTDTIVDNSMLPSVSRLIQLGTPNIPKQYLRRIEKLDTKLGNGTILLNQYEVDFAIGKIEEVRNKKLKRRELELNEDVEKNGHYEMLDGCTKAKAKAYQSWMGYYMKLRGKLGWSKEELVEKANEWALTFVGKIPELTKRSIDHLRLRGVEGLLVEEVK